MATDIGGLPASAMAGLSISGTAFGAAGFTTAAGAALVAMAGGGATGLGGAAGFGGAAGAPFRLRASSPGLVRRERSIFGTNVSFGLAAGLERSCEPACS